MTDVVSISIWKTLNKSGTNLITIGILKSLYTTHEQSTATRVAWPFISFATSEYRFIPVEIAFSGKKRTVKNQSFRKTCLKKS